MLDCCLLQTRFVIRSVMLFSMLTCIRTAMPRLLVVS